MANFMVRVPTESSRACNSSYFAAQRFGLFSLGFQLSHQRRPRLRVIGIDARLLSRQHIDVVDHQLMQRTADALH